RFPWGSPSWDATPCGGADVRGTPSRCRTCCLSRVRCSSPRRAPPATPLMPGRSTTAFRLLVTRWRTSWCRRTTCGTTFFIGAGTSGSSAPRSVGAPGSIGRGSRAATSWTYRPCGGSPPGGTREGWNGATLAASPAPLRTIWAAWISPAAAGASRPEPSTNARCCHRRCASARRQHAELVTVRVGQHDPADVALADVDTGRAEGEQSLDLDVLVTAGEWGEVDVHPALPVVRNQRRAAPRDLRAAGRRADRGLLVLVPDQRP